MLAENEEQGKRGLKVLEEWCKEWGSCGQLAPIEKIQLRVARIFLGVGRLHPKVSLLFELNTLPLKWEGMKRCIEFWVKVMRMGEDRLLKQVMVQVMELKDGVRWRQALEKV